MYGTRIFGCFRMDKEARFAALLTAYQIFGSLMLSKSFIHVAYADDHEMFRQGVRELLANSSRIVFTIDAIDGKELIQKLATSKQSVDVCVLDIFMPKMDGYAALLEIRTRWPELRVLVLTGHNTEYYLIKMIRAGASGYLLKNSSPREIEKAIVTVHEDGTYYSLGVNTRLATKAARQQVDVPDLSPKEIEVLRACCSDMSYVQIAEQLEMSLNAVEYCRVSLCKKLNVSSRPGLVVMAMELGLLELHSRTFNED